MEIREMTVRDCLADEAELPRDAMILIPRGRGGQGLKG